MFLLVDWNANLEMFLAIAVLGVSLVLAAVSFLAYSRLRNRRALLIGIGFAAFAIKGAYLVSQSYRTRGSEEWLVPVALLDLFILAFLYLAVRTR